MKIIIAILGLIGTVNLFGSEVIGILFYYPSDFRTRNTISYGHYYRGDGDFSGPGGGALDTAVEEIFKRVNDAKILGQDPISLQKIEYSDDIMILKIAGKGGFAETTRKALRICVKLTIEDMIGYPAPKKLRNKIPSVIGFKFIYTHSDSFSVPKEGVFTVTQEINKK